MDFRILYPNRTIDVIKVDYPFPEYNFCFFGSETYYRIDVERSFPNFISILYVNSTDLSSASYYILLASRTGKIISNTYIAPVPIINGELYADGYLYSHQSEEFGFIFSYYETKTIVAWSYFSQPDIDGNFHPINYGKFYLQNPSDYYSLFPGMDGSFVIVTKNSTDIQTKSNKFINPSEFTTKIYVYFVRPTMKVDGPFLLYQSAIPRLKVEFYCDTAYTSTGDMCILIMKPHGTTETHLMKISFQNSGSVSSVNKFANTMGIKSGDDIMFNYMYYGGYLVRIFRKVDSNNNRLMVQGIILDNDGNYNGTWNYPQNLILPAENSVTTYRNGTMILAYHENEYTWKLLFTDLPRFIPDGYGYDNPNIKATYPSINSNIPLTTTNINITYFLSVTASANYISIYQYNEDYPILRQSISGNSPLLSYSSDNMTINIKILESTFNQPNSLYYVVIDYNAVKDWKSNQPLMGIERNHWKFNTTNYQEIFAGDAVGQLSLTIEGTKYYESLSSYDQGRFLSQLRIDLAKSIPVDNNRLDDIKCCIYDKSQQFPKIILSLPIKSTTSQNERNVDNIIKDLDILVKEKEITPISRSNTTNLLEASFGFRRTRNFLDDLNSFKYHLIGIVIGVIILGLLYVYAKKRNPRGKNFAIFKFPLIISDLILSITFILNNGKNVPQLFIPSIIFFIIPMAISFMMSIIIILREIKKNRYFYGWFKNNTHIATLFTILASIDLEMLNILSSQVAGVMLFSAPISEKMRLYIFLGSFIGFFIDDIPRFIIQVLYRKLVVNYDIIPFLTLLTSSIILANNIISRIYHAIVYLRKKRRISLMNIIYDSNVEKSITVPQITKKKSRYSM
ncbi:glycosyltransferase family 2 protein [Rhizophagus clarus]|nr:glycosyltransferase family 2 protein [Rhizophagus clarus]